MQAFRACQYLQSVIFLLLLPSLQLATGLRTRLLVPARSQATAPGHLRDKKSLQSLFCSAVSVTARPLCRKNMDGTNWQHFTDTSTRMPIYTCGSPYHCVKEWFKRKKEKSATLLMVNSAKNTVQLFLSELHRKS